MLVKLNTDVYLLEYPPPPSLQWEIEQIKTGGTENQQWRTSWRLSWFKTTQLSMIVKFNTDVCLLEFQHRWYKNLQHIDLDINITSNPVVCSLSVLLQTKLFYLCWQKYLYLQSHCLILLSTNHTVHVFFLIKNPQIRQPSLTRKK